MGIGVDTMKKYTLEQFIEKINTEFQLEQEVHDEASYLAFLDACRTLVMERKLHVKETQSFDDTQFYTVTSNSVGMIDLFLKNPDSHMDYGLVEISQYITMGTSKEKRKVLSLECDDYKEDAKECLAYTASFPLHSLYELDVQLEVDFNKNNLIEVISTYFVDACKKEGCTMRFQSIKGLHPFQVNLMIEEGEVECIWSREVQKSDASKIASILFLQMLGSYEVLQKYPVYFYEKDE